MKDGKAVMALPSLIDQTEKVPRGRGDEDR